MADHAQDRTWLRQAILGLVTLGHPVEALPRHKWVDSLFGQWSRVIGCWQPAAQAAGPPRADRARCPQQEPHARLVPSKPCSPAAQPPQPPRPSCQSLTMSQRNPRRRPTVACRAPRPPPPQQTRRSRAKSAARPRGQRPTRSEGQLGSA